MKNILILLIAVSAIALYATKSIASENMGVDIHGFISQGYFMSTDDAPIAEDADNDFLFNEVGINFSKELTDSLRFGIQLFSRDFADDDNNDINIDWAYADYAFSDAIGFRFGQIKIPRGLYNETRDVNMLGNSIFLPESVYGDLTQDLYVNDFFLSLQGISSRDLFMSLQGLGIYGYVELNALGEISYQAMFGTQKIDTNENLGSKVDYITSLFGATFPENSIEGGQVDVDYKYAGNLIWDTPLTGLRFGVSMDNIKMTTTSKVIQDIVIGWPVADAGDVIKVDYKKRDNWVASVEYVGNNLILMAEYLKSHKKYDIAFGNLPDESKEENPWGYYAGGALRFTDWAELGGYYSHSQNDDMDMNQMMTPIGYFYELDDICGTIRFDINEYWTFKLEAHHFKGIFPQLVDPLDTSHTGNEKDETTWSVYAANMTVAF